MICGRPSTASSAAIFASIFGMLVQISSHRGDNHDEWPCRPINTDEEPPAAA